MNRDTRTKSKNSQEYDFDDFLNMAVEQLNPITPDSIVDAVATQLHRSYEARKRVDEEGIVVRDLKGSVIPHPAIKIEQDSTKLLADLFKKFGRKI